MVSSRRSTASQYQNGQDGESNHKAESTTYETLMGEEGGHAALTSRLISFRKWIQNAGCQVHPAVCIVNGEATDGTKNAPVLVLGPPSSSASSSSSSMVPNTGASTLVSALTVSKSLSSSSEGRCGSVDKDEDRALYDRTIGCQIRTTREMKEGQVMMTVPRTVMIHPDLIAGSDVGRIALACCEPPTSEGELNFWDAFGHTATIQETHMNKLSSSGGTQLLVKILQERKKAETILAKAAKAVEEGNHGENYKLAPTGSISARAVYLLFLIQQRFSDEVEPKVTSNRDYHGYSTKDDASFHVDRIGLAEGTPESFAPYARTLPPFVPLPMCWKRNELATLASCIPGVSLMQEVAAQILTFSSDLIALVEAGILHRFPSLISPKLLTWDRWLWAGSVHMSRVLPCKCYLNRGEEAPENHVVTTGEVFYSPPHVWADLGVMVPLVDMLNHEVQESQIKWESPEISRNDDDDFVNQDTMTDNVAKVVVQKRVKKGSQIYTTYNIDSNQNLILQYGFAQMANDADSVQIGWALQDGVGNCPKPSDYIPLIGDEEQNVTLQDDFVYESSDLDVINLWWTEDRLAVLQKAMKADASFWKNLRNGKKMVSAAYSDGTYEPKLLTALVVATMSQGDIQKFLSASSASSETDRITLSRRHQRVLRHHMAFLFSRKFERLLQNIGNGLKAHFNELQLWTKATEGGLDYKGRQKSNCENMELSEASSEFVGWNTFFDAFAYGTSIEIEARYYALAPESCVLTLYDGQLRALQKSIDGVSSENAFHKSVIPMLQDLDFILSEDDEVENNDYQEHGDKKDNVDVCNTTEPQSKDTQAKDTDLNAKKNEQKNPSAQKQVKKVVSKPSIKLHIGNLSYQTTPTSLSNYFGSRYGRDTVIECHIPTERETGKSRGFGFVTLTENIALRILHEKLPHNIDGRVVKIAESNTSIQARGGQISSGAPPFPNERCTKCGYRPRYCTCFSSNHPVFPNRDMQGISKPLRAINQHQSNPPYSSKDAYGGRGSSSLNPMRDYDGYEFERDAIRNGYAGSSSRHGKRLTKDRSYSPSPSPRRHRDRSYDRYHDYRHPNSFPSNHNMTIKSRGRSRSRSISMDRDRRSRRSTSYEKRSRKRRSSRRSSRYSHSRSRSRSRSLSPNISHSSPKESPPRGRHRERNTNEDSRLYSSNSNLLDRNERSQSRSNIMSNNANMEDNALGREEAKRSHRDKSRSRSRERSSRSRRHSSKRSHKTKERSSRQRNRSFSRSRSYSF